MRDPAGVLDVDARAVAGAALRVGQALDELRLEMVRMHEDGGTFEAIAAAAGLTEGGVRKAITGEPPE